MIEEYSGLEFWEPKHGLWRSQQCEGFNSANKPSPKARRLESKALLEFRQADLFAYGRSILQQTSSFRFAMTKKEKREDSVDAVLIILR